MTITVETFVKAPVAAVWKAYTTPADIKQWNTASADWHTTQSSVDLRVGGAFSSRMEAKDGSFGFDFAGIYTRLVTHKTIEYSFGDRKAVVDFIDAAGGVTVRVSFDAETTHPVEQQRQGWQAILNNFAKHVEATCGPAAQHAMKASVTPYLSFGGTTREAFAFYERALGATVGLMLSFADMPAADPAGTVCGTGMPAAGDGIMHGRLSLPGGALLYAGDPPPGVAFQGMQGVMLALEYETVEEATTAFQALAQGGTITMPLAPSFWAQTFGMVTDRFGVSWAVSGASLPVN